MIQKRILGKTLLRTVAICAVMSVFVFAFDVRAAAWNSIEPLKSRRADVEKTLGQPLNDKLDEAGELHFKVAGGTVTVAFVSAKFVADKKLPSAYEGTVLQIILQHDAALDTPEMLKVLSNPNFDKIADKDVVIYRNNKEGIAYTFVKNQLKTTRYFYTAAQVKGAPTLQVKRPKIFGHQF